MSKSVLIKDFKSKDVARMRNLITKKHGDSSSTQVGYKKVNIKHKEGETWDEDGKTWTITNGIKTTVSKLDVLKKLMAVPLVCPECGKPLKHHLDKKMYKLKQKCLDCVISFESKLKIEGKYVEYEKNLFNGNIDAIITEIEAEAIDFILNGADSMVTESGEIEDWGANVIDKDKVNSEVQEWIEKLKQLYI